MWPGERMGGFPKKLLHILEPCLAEGDWVSAHLWEIVNKFPFHFVATALFSYLIGII